MQMNFDCIEYLTEFCLNEIALQGLEGCRITDLFDLLHNSATNPASFINNEESSGLYLLKLNAIFVTIQNEANSEANSMKNFIWKLLLNQFDLNFYLEPVKDSEQTSHENNSSKNAKQPFTSKFRSLIAAKSGNETFSHIISNSQVRGFCRSYHNRKCLNSQLKPDYSDDEEQNEFAFKSFQECLNEFGARLIVVASQQSRNKVLSPSYKHLDFENLNDMEYCVLERIGKSRYEGVCSIGQEGLTQLFNIVPKQLHYILNILESNDLIKKQVCSSEKKRSLIHLTRYASKRKNHLELICDYLFFKCQVKKTGAFDSTLNIRRKMCISTKQLKSIIAQGESQNILKRYVHLEERNSTSKNRKSKSSMPVRMLKLTDSYFDSILNTKASLNTQEDELEVEIDNEEEEEEQQQQQEQNRAQNSSAIECSSFYDDPKSQIGSAQTNLMPLYAQLFGKIEQFGKYGISLKQMGTFFGFDFYKSRRMGNNLQMHSDIVTIVKETNRGKAKYQAIMMRKFIDEQQTNSNQSESKNDNEHEANDKIESFEPAASEITIIKREKSTSCKDGSIMKKNLSIQALIANRSVTRKKIIFAYLEKHPICTKYEINREIRSREAEQGLKGSIDSKTTKRMLEALAKEQKLHIFEVMLKNVSYMCVRSVGISEDDEQFKNYCQTFKRTFDADVLKLKREPTSEAKQHSDDEKNTTINDSINSISIAETATANNYSKENHNFSLTSKYIDSIVEKLSFSNSYAKTYGLVPKVQKAIILQRFLHYLLFFYDGKQQQSVPVVCFSNTTASGQDWTMFETVKVPDASRTYKPYCNVSECTWQTFVPPLNRSTFHDPKEKNCIFVGEILSHMPLSIFSAIGVINYQIPGLLALLKNPLKRHILVKDLPPQIVAPLIHERRYIRRIIANIQFLVSLGLVSMIESPCKANEAINRDTQSQAIYVYRRAAFYDTTTNKSKDWNELIAFNKLNFDSKNSTSECKYEKLCFEFKSDNEIIDYWRRLVNVSVNTFKFNVANYLKEDKQARKKMQEFINKKHKLSELEDLWRIENKNVSDHMGPGGYDSQLFLHYFQNWSVQSSSGPNYSKSKSSNKTTNAITREADQTCAPHSELALLIPYDVFRGLQSAFADQPRQSLCKKKPSKRKTQNERREKENDESSLTHSPRKKLKLGSALLSKLKQPNAQNVLLNKLKLKKAKLLVDKAKQKAACSTKQQQHKIASLIQPSSSIDNNNEEDKSEEDKQASIRKRSNPAHKTRCDKRAQWHPREDEIILLIKIASLYLMPGERCIPFRLVYEVMHALMSNSDKSVESIGRRLKVLMKLKMNRLFVLNKFELCKQDAVLNRKYANEKAKLKRQTIDKVCVQIYTSFIQDLIDRHVKKRSYGSAVFEDDGQMPIQLPDSVEEFKQKYEIVHSSLNRDLVFKNNLSCFKQPTTDYEIMSNTLHSAIHSSILINDKNPRAFESFHLFDKYSDQLLTDVITKMSRDHRIIAPTKYSELRKKNVTAFSKHIGKAYHISQRYQYKWINKISPMVLDETKKFKDELVDFKLRQQQQQQSVEQQNLNDSRDSMFDCTDIDDLGMTSFLAHTIDNSDILVQIDVPNKIWVSKFI